MTHPAQTTQTTQTTQTAHPAPPTQLPPADGPGRAAVRHGGVHDLPALVEELGAAADASHARRSGRTVVAVGGLRVTAIALAAGAELAEHDSPGAATLQVLAGTCRLVTADRPDDGDGGTATELTVGSLAQIPPVRHSLTTEDGCVVLLTVDLGRSGP